MLLKISLAIVYLSIYVVTTRCSIVETEKSLRRDIKHLLDGKLRLSSKDLSFSKQELQDHTPKNHSSYDFIVIGAGTAGSAIAARLSENCNATVLLIEAGGKEYSIFDVPTMALAMQIESEFSWNYKSERTDKYCLAQENQRCHYPAGKVMGGGSTVNSFLGTRGNRRDYDIWARITEDKSWSYKYMLKYFKKLEDFHPNGIRYNRAFRNKGGPMHLTVAPKRLPICKSFIKAGEELGYPESDYNGPEQIGFTYYQNTMYNGERWSTNKGYLRPAKNRENLFVTQHSHVHKIKIDKRTKRAYGVKFSKYGETFVVRARREIIVSAGAFNSPQILMLSGIGPKKHIQELNIDLIKDAPVGENLLDHTLYGRQLKYTVTDSSLFDVPNIMDPKDTSIKQYVNDRTGPLSLGSIIQAVSWVNVDDPSNLWPDIRIAFYPGNVWITNDTVSGNKKPAETFGIQPMLLRPRSRGTIRLKSNNPFDAPIINPNYLADPEDVRVLIKGIRFSMKIGETAALKKHGAKYQNFTSPCDCHGIDSDKYWECELRYNMRSVYHLGGTCKMGHERSKSSVVDSKLRVIGIKGLRVADASIIPDNIAGHVNVPIMAIGEKAADLVKHDHNDIYQNKY